MKAEILKIIAVLSDEKRDAKEFPVIVLDVELQKAVKEKVLEAIRELWKEKEVDLGRTCNHNYVEIRKPNSPPRKRKIVLHKI